MLALIYRLLVAKKARKGTLLEGATDATEGFGPLKVVLGAIPAIYANREVCIQPSAQNYPLLNAFQESAAAGNKIECLLPRIVALEERFNSRPSDVAEQRRRDELIQYATIPPSMSGADFPQRTQWH